MQAVLMALCRSSRNGRHVAQSAREWCSGFVSYLEVESRAPHTTKIALCGPPAYADCYDATGYSRARVKESKVLWEKAA
jgi:hypothetical protein